MREGLRLAVVGCGLGLAAAWATSRLLEAQLYGVGSHDVVSFAGSAAILTLAAAVACWIPARRATAASPMDALRAD